MQRHVLSARRVTWKAVGVALLIALGATALVAAPMSAHADAATGSGGLYVQRPVRVWDTNSTTGNGGAPQGTLSASKWYPVGIDGVNGIPTSGVSAVTVNFTVEDASTPGYLYADKTGVAAPNTSMPYLIYGSGSLSNSATIPVGTDGKIQVRLSTAVNLRVDVQGYYTSGVTAAGGYVPTTATPVASTLTGIGVAKAKVATGAAITFTVGGTDPVPSNAASAMLTITESGGAASGGGITAYRGGAARTVNALYWPNSRNAEWTTAVPLGTNGSVTVYVNGGGPINLEVAVIGYFTQPEPNSATAPGSFTTTAQRVYDSTPSPSNPIPANSSRTIQITGVNGLPAAGSGITSVAVNFTIVSGSSSGGNGNFQAYADDQNAPSTSTQQFYAGKFTSAYTVVPLGADGGITVTNNSSGDMGIIVDVEGWYSGNPLDPTISCASPYSNGSWTTAIPSDGVACTVTAPPVGASGAQMVIGLDGAYYSESDLVNSASTTASVIVPPQGGLHTISAEIDDADANMLSVNDFTFGLGDWANKALVPMPGDGTYANDQGQLSVSPAGDSFGDDTRFQYTVSSSSDGVSNPLVSTGWIPGALTIPQGLLTPGNTYYWKATAQGTSGGSSTIRTVASPVASFIASDAQIDPACATALHGAGVSSGQMPVEQDYANYCVITVDVAADDASQSQDATSTGAVSRAASTVKTKTWKATASDFAHFWSTTMQGRFYYDGTKAWSKTSRRGYTGYMYCDVNGRSPYTIEKVYCQDQPIGSSDVNFETFKVTFGWKGSPANFTRSFHVKLAKDGTESGGQGTGL